MAHDVEHERVLDAVLVGDVALDAPAVDALRGCAECRARLTADAELERAIGDADDEIASLLTQAARGPVAGEDAAVAGFRATAGIEPARFPAGRRVLLALVAAAAAAVLAIVAVRLRSAPAGGGRGPLLNRPAIECLAPVGRWTGPTDELEFRWRADASPSTRYTLRVFDAGEKLLFAAEGLREPRYAPPADQRAQLRGRVRWEVLALDATEVVVGSDDAEARF